MTTVATDGVTLATDGRTTANNEIITQRAKKLHRLPDGSVLGESGACTDAKRAIEELSDAIGSGREPHRMTGDYALLRLLQNGKAVVYWRELTGIEIPTPAAVGSGAEFARGAMFAGASAKDAVRIAIKLDRNSGGRIQAMKVGR